MSRGRPLLWAVAIGIVPVYLGCKSDDNPGAAFVTRYCEIYKPCCVAAGLPGDGKACQARFASSASQRGKYNATAGESCLSGLNAISGQPGFCEGDLVPPFTCAQAFGGTTGACIQDADCPASSQGEVRCISSGTQLPKCQIQSRGQLGSTPCVGDVRGNVTLYGGTMSADVPDLGYLCYADDSLRCDRDSGACVALLAAGASCALSTDCVDADFCDSNAATAMCTARRGSGAACIGQALECQDGLFCDELSAMVCVAQRDVGASCTNNVECLTVNCPDGTCQPTPAVGPNPLCVAPDAP